MSSGEAGGHENAKAGPERLATGARRDLPALLALHRELSEAQGGVVVLEGPRGVGKASLLIALRAELAAQGRLVLLGRGEQSATAPYAALREPAAQALAFLESRGLAESYLEDHGAALAVLLPGLQASTLSRTLDKAGFFEAMRAFFLALANVSPPTLLVTDVHHADDDTRDLLRFLALHLFHPDGVGGDPAEGFAGVLMIASRTDDEAGARIVEQLCDGHPMRRFAVSGLGPKELLEYLDGHPGFEKLLRASRGCPEDVDELLEALPDDTDTLLRQRVGELDEPSQRILHALAVLGRPAPPDLLARVLGAPVGEVAQRLAGLVERRLLWRRLQNGELLFTFLRPHHPEVLRTSLAPGMRAAWHLAIGRALEARGGGADHDALLAHHFLRGSEPVRGVPYALAASERLLLTFAYGSAAELIHDALPHAVEEERFRLLGHLVEAERLRGQLPRAEEAAEQMRAIADPEHMPQVLRTLAEVLSGRGEHRRAIEILQQALCERAPSSSEDPLPERARMLAAMAEASYAQGDLDETARYAGDALAEAPAAPVAFRLRVANTIAKIAYARARFEEAEAGFLENLRVAEAHELDVESMQARVNTGLARFRLGRYESARDVLERALGQARAAGDVSYEAQALLNLGAICQRTSEFGRAIRYFQGALSLFARMGRRGQMRLTTWNLANIYIALGIHDVARSFLEQSRRMVELEDSERGRAFLLFSEADIAFDRGDFSQARTAYEDARLLFQQVGDRARVIEMATKSAWASLRQGDVQAAAALLDELAREERTPLSELRWQMAQAACRARGLADAGVEESAPAMAEFSHRIDALIEERADEDAWRGLIFLADCHERRGDPGGAAAALARARALAARFAERLPAELREPFLAHMGHLLSGAPDASAPASSIATVSAPPASGEPVAFSHAGAAAPVAPQPSLGGSRGAAAGGGSGRSPAWDRAYPEMVGESPSLLRVFDRLDRISRMSGATVLIRGESGTGKELVAAAIHRMGERRQGPFVRVNCAALVETLLLSELFGHEKGSFTGAFSRKIGRFELARGGTLFLDEIGDISPKTQVSLLRVLQERSFERVGGTQTIATDAAVICATHRDLESMVSEGTFREDLYYRLRGVVVEVPALRDRPEDIPLLVAEVLDRSRQELGRAPARISPAAQEILMRYRWPGNIRELQNVVRSVALFCEGDCVEPEHLRDFPELFDDRSRVVRRPPVVTEGAVAPPASAPQASAPPALRSAPLWPAAAPASPERPVSAPPPPMPASPHPASRGPATAANWLRGVEAQASEDGVALVDLKRRLEFEAIANAMRQTQGNVTRAAALLKMKRPRLSQIVNGDPQLKAIKEQSRARNSPADD